MPTSGTEPIDVVAATSGTRAGPLRIDRRDDLVEELLEVELGDQLGHPHCGADRTEEGVEIGQPTDDGVEATGERTEHLGDSTGTDAVEIERNGHVEVEPGQVDVGEQRRQLREHGESGRSRRWRSSPRGRQTAARSGAHDEPGPQVLPGTTDGRRSSR